MRSGGTVRLGVRRRRGSALLMVLWISAALAAISFSLASTVRGEAERTGTAVDSLRGYFLGVGAIQRGIAELAWSAVYPDRRAIPQGATFVDYNFPSGMARLEIIPEASRLDVNYTTVVELIRLLMALGEPEDRARVIASAIEDWRRPGPPSVFDAFYQGQIPSFRASHASILEIEELLLVRGVTPELFYGTYVPVEPDESAPAAPRLVKRWGLADCLSVYGSRDRVDANTAAPPVLAAVGLNQYAIAALLERRARAPLRDAELPAFLQSLGAPSDRLRTEGNTIVTMRATARVRLQDGRLSDVRRTVGAQVKYFQKNSTAIADVLRWYDTTWSN